MDGAEVRNTVDAEIMRGGHNGPRAVTAVGANAKRVPLRSFADGGMLEVAPPGVIDFMCRY